MGFLYNIKKIRIFHHHDRYRLVVDGWCVDKKHKLLPEILVNLNGKKAMCDVISLSRQDIVNIFELDKALLHNGFKIILETDQIIKNLEIIAQDTFQRKTLQRCKEPYLKKKITDQPIECYLEQCFFHGEADRVTLSGWAVSLDGDELAYSVMEENETEIAIEYEAVERKDLMEAGIVEENQKKCGFVINFCRKPEKHYYLKIAGGDAAVSMDSGLGKRSIIKKLQKHIGDLSFGKILNYSSYLYNYMKRIDPQLLRNRIFKKEQISYYDRWFREQQVSGEILQRQREETFDFRPKISIIVPTYNTPVDFLREMIASVQAQSYTDWELCIADGSDETHPARALIREYTEKDKRIKVAYLEENYGISGNTNKALELAAGAYVGLFDHDDLLEPDALYEVVKCLQPDPGDVQHTESGKYDIVYTDEDMYNSTAKTYQNPILKPDYSPDAFLSHNYITHFFVVRREIIQGIGGFLEEYDGSQDYDLMFRCIERAKGIYHIPKILYHWRMHYASTAANPESKMYCYIAGQRAIQDHLNRSGVAAEVEMLPQFWGMYHVKYKTVGEPLITVIITNITGKKYLTDCVSSLLEKNTYRNIEIILINHKKDLRKTCEEICLTSDRISMVDSFEDGIEKAKGEALFFLDANLVLLEENSLREMVGHCLRPDVGAVGAKILYHKDKLWHAGVILGADGTCQNAFQGENQDSYGYMVRPKINFNYSVVSGKALMTSRTKVQSVRETLARYPEEPFEYPLCLAYLRQGKYNVYNAFAQFYLQKDSGQTAFHYPSSVKQTDSPMDSVKDYLQGSRDRFYNPNFNLPENPSGKQFSVRGI